MDWLPLSCVTAVTSGLSCTGWLQRVVLFCKSFCNSSALASESPHRDWFYLQMSYSVVNECFVVSIMVEWEFIYCGMLLWDCEILSISSLGALHPIKLCFTKLVFILNLYIGFFYKEENSACAVTFSPSTPNYTFLWFLICFSAEMAVSWGPCSQLLSFRSGQLDLTRDECVLTMWHAGFSPSHLSTAPHLPGLKEGGL